MSCSKATATRGVVNGKKRRLGLGGDFGEVEAVAFAVFAEGLFVFDQHRANHGGFIGKPDIGHVIRNEVCLIMSVGEGEGGLGDHEMRISFPVFEGRRGNPVLWGRGFFKALAGLSGDIGGRRILAENPAAVNSISWTDDSIHNDIDTGDDLRRHLRG